MSRTARKLAQALAEIESLRSELPKLLASLDALANENRALRATLRSQLATWEIIADEISRDPGRVGGQQVGHEPGLAYATPSVKHRLRNTARHRVDEIKAALGETTAGDARSTGVDDGRA